VADTPKRSAQEVLKLLKQASRNIPDSPKAGAEVSKSDLQRAFSYIHSDPLSKLSKTKAGNK
jgi:hypothetical protein